MRVSFGEFAFDRGAHQLRRGSKERHLEPKAFELLDLLLARRPEAVSKAEIKDRLWPDTFVSESSLTSLVAQLRGTLGDKRKRPKLIRTVHGFGYAFAGEARDEPGPSEGTAATAASTRGSPACVVWAGREFALADGENVLGRDPESAVCIEHTGVSRCHARIVVTGRRATLEDLGSKNGTFIRDQRIETPQPLVDGDFFDLGRLSLRFHFASGGPDSTKTERGEERHGGGRTSAG
ncbi:MAG TPA: FHA domain-containing protein [Vicinamibacteria bacterium]|nr:FHA domain-containing protein [Vicinamibacteria bacterium]